MSASKWTRDYLCLCREQKFRVETNRAEFFKVFHPLAKKHPVVVFYSTRKDEAEVRKELQSIGVKFPGYLTTTQAERIVMAEQKSNGIVHVSSDPRGTPAPAATPESQRLCRILDSAAESILTAAVNIQEASKILKASHMVDSGTLEKLRAMETLLGK